MNSLRKFRILYEKVKVLISCVSHYDCIKLDAEPSLKTILVTKIIGIRLECVPSSDAPNSSKLTRNAKQVLNKCVMEYSRHEIS